MVASASAGSRKNNESGYSRWTVDADPAEMLHDELREEVAQLRRLRLVSGRIVLDRLGAADIVDANDSGLTLAYVAAVGSSGRQSEGDQRHENERDLEVGVHHQRGAVQLHELPFGVLQRLRVEVRNRGVMGLPH